MGCLGGAPSLFDDDGLIFRNDLITSAVPQRAFGDPTPTFTRATTKTCKDFEGRTFTALAGEWVSQGARRVYNLLGAFLTNTDTLANPSATTNCTRSTPTDTPPPGVSAVCKLTEDNTNNTHLITRWMTTSGNRFWHSVYAKAAERSIIQLDDSGALGTANFNLSTGAVSVINGAGYIQSIGNGWYRCFVTGSGSSGLVDISIQTSMAAARQAAYQGDGASGVLLAGWSYNDNALGSDGGVPQEYVSMGVLAAPYHGACVDSVKYFATLNGFSISGTTVTEATGAPINSATSKFGVGLGGVGDQWSTPDSAAISITGSFDVDVCLAADDWTPAANTFVTGKDAQLKRNWSFGLQATTGKLMVEVYDSQPSANIGAVSSTAPVVSDRTKLWVRVKVTWALAGNIAYDFYTSQDGSTWDQLGSQQTTAATGFYMADYDTGLRVGGREFSGATQETAGRFYRARLYSGSRDAGGTLVSDWNPNDFSSGTTWTSATTGEVWTINGNARVFGGSGTSSIPAPWDAVNPFGYDAWMARTNICYPSVPNATDWPIYPAGSATVTNNSTVNVDGATTAALLKETATNSAHGMYGGGTAGIPLAPTNGSVYTVWWYAKAKERTKINVAVTNALRADGVYAEFNLATGAIITNATTIAACAPVANSAFITAGVNGWFKIGFSFTCNAALAAACYHAECLLDATGTFSYVGDNASGLYVGAGQIELGASAGPLITTTTAAATRNGDVENYPSAGNIKAGSGTIYLEYTPTNVATAALDIFRIQVSGGNFVIRNQAGTVRFIYVDKILDADTITAGATAKIAVTWNGANGSVCVNGGTVASTTSAAAIGTITSPIGIGEDNSGSGQPLGEIRRVKIYGTQKDIQEMTR